MFKELIPSLRACAVTFLACAVIYPATVWALAALIFPNEASGSLLIRKDRSVVGSALVAQKFESDRYFHPRPSACDYKAEAASGSNLGPHNADLRKAVAERAGNLKATPEHPAPVDLVMASGSGLDPEITVEAAEYQAPRVASARGIDLERVRGLIAKTTDRSGAVLGAPARVNVLRLNLALDDEEPSPR